LRLQRRGLRPPRPRPGPSRLFTVTANNKRRRRRGDQHAGRRPGLMDHRRLSDPAAAPATGRRRPRPLVAAAKKPDRVTNNMSTGICADAVSRRRPPGRSQIQRAYHAPLRPSGVTWRAQPPLCFQEAAMGGGLSPHRCGRSVRSPR
jgi:hypothetical protein